MGVLVQSQYSKNGFAGLSNYVKESRIRGLVSSWTSCLLKHKIKIYILYMFYNVNAALHDNCQ